MATRVSFRQLTALALMTASLLGYELLLTRAIAIQHWHHLTAVVIAVALLGLGGAGSLAAALSATMRRHEGRLMPTAALATAFSIPLSLLVAQQVPLNMLALPWYGQQAGLLLLYALCYVVPFFSGAVYITLAFMRWSDAIGRCYAADLIGSALGAVLVLAWLDGKLLAETTLESAFRLSACLPVLAFLLLAKIQLRQILIAGVAGVFLFFGFFGARVAIKPSPSKALSVQLTERDAQVLWQQDSSQSRLTLVQSHGQHLAPGLSISSIREAPRQWQVYSDGEDASPLLRDADQSRYRGFFEQVITSAAYRAAPEPPSVLLLPGHHSWNSWSAYWHRAQSITLVEPDLGLAGLLSGRPFPSERFLPQGIQLQVMQPRRFLESTESRFDLIVADMGSHPVGSSATRVQYLLTHEALDRMLTRLSADGVLAITGNVMPLPRDSLRLLHSLIQVLHDRHLAPQQHLVVIRDWQNLLVIVSRQPFALAKLEALSEWCRQWRFDRVAMPGLKAEDANRFHQKPDAIYFESTRRLLSGSAKKFVADYPFALSVTNDNRPFFYHFFRWGHWQQVKQWLGQPWLLYVGWGYLLNLFALAVLALAAIVLIFAPFMTRSLREQLRRPRLAVVSYFGAIGMGFMFIEIALIQKALLLMESPTSAFAVVVVAMLLGAGGGSLWSGRGTVTPKHIGMAPFGIGLLSLAALSLFGPLSALTGANAEGIQVGLVTLLLIALAFPMGMMLPQGIARIRSQGPGAVAWGWGINGFFSVLGALAAPLIAIEIGILGLVGCAVGLYLLAAGSFLRLRAPS